MKLANYRSGMLRFSVSTMLISILILSNLFFYYPSSQSDVGNGFQKTCFSQQKASISGIIFDNSLSIPVSCNCFEKHIENGFENLDALIYGLNYKSKEIASIENSLLSFEILQNSESFHVAYYLMNCAIKIPFRMV